MAGPREAPPPAAPRPARALTVVQLLPALASGGVERSTLEISAALVAAGHRSVVVSAGGRLVPALEAAGGEHVTLDIGRKSPLTLLRARALRRLLDALAPDIVHARSRLPAWVARLALGRDGLAPVPPGAPHLVTTVHGLNSPSRYSAILARGERVVCVSGGVRAHLLAHYPWVDPARLRVIPRGIDAAAFPRADAGARAAARAALAGLLPPGPGGADGPLLLLPGRGTRLKGHADALHLLAGLHADGVPARLWMPGAREPGREAYVAELEALAARLGVAGSLRLDPPTDAIARAYAASDLVLQLSRKPEAFGRTVVEALAVGTPVLGWDHGGVGELLREAAPEGAVAPFDAPALRARAARLLETPPAPPATIPWTLHAMCEATLQLYADLTRHR